MQHGFAVEVTLIQALAGFERRIQEFLELTQRSPNPACPEAARRAANNRREPHEVEHLLTVMDVVPDESHTQDGLAVLALRSSSLIGGTASSTAAPAIQDPVESRHSRDRFGCRDKRLLDSMPVSRVETQSCLLETVKGISQLE